jgi:hypothetical protein
VHGLISVFQVFSLQPQPTHFSQWLFGFWVDGALLIHPTDLTRIFHKLARALTFLLINKKDFAQSGV